MQARNVGEILSDTFTVTTVDGTSKVVIIIISGANDAAVISGETTGTVVEAGGVDNGTPGTPTATGDLNSTDVDNPNDAWTAVSFPTAAPAATAATRSPPPGCGPTRWTTTMRPCRRSMRAIR